MPSPTNSLTAAAATLTPLTTGPHAPQDAGPAQVGDALAACSLAFAALTGVQPLPGSAAHPVRSPFLTLDTARTSLSTPPQAPGSAWATTTAAHVAAALHVLAQLATAHQLAPHRC